MFIPSLQAYVTTHFHLSISLTHSHSWIWGNWESSVNLTFISLDHKGKLEYPGEAHTGTRRVYSLHAGREGHWALPEDLFLSNEERHWQLLTLCSQWTTDEVRSSTSFFFSSFSVAKLRLPSALLQYAFLFIINQYAFNLSDPGTEAFLCKFKTLCVCSVLDI